MLGEPRASWARPISEYFQEVSAEQLPIAPFLGDNVGEVARFLVRVCDHMVAAARMMKPRSTRATWAPKTDSEYDFAGHVLLTVKPWLGDLAREEVAIRYDGQEKRADFNLLGSRIIVQMKYVSDAGTKAGAAKTLVSVAAGAHRLDLLREQTISTVTTDLERLRS